MLTHQEARQVIGHEVYGRDGEKIGQVGQVFLDSQTDQPEFITVNTGLFGMKENFVPVADAYVAEGNLKVPFSKDKVKEAPKIDADTGELTHDDEATLYDYYGMSYDPGGAGMPTAGSAGGAAGSTYHDTEEDPGAGVGAGDLYAEEASSSGRTTGGAAPTHHDTEDPGAGVGPGDLYGDEKSPSVGGGPSARPEDPGAGVGPGDRYTGGAPATDPAARGRSGRETDDAMTRSEERLDVGHRTEETGRARLRKYVETEEVQVSVPVSRERAVIEREPITDENRDEAMSGQEISEDEHEVILHEEKPVVGKHAEPVERVRLSKEEESREEQVSAELRKERIETEGDVDDR